MRRRVWCETLPFDEVVRPAVVEVVARYRLDLLLAVRPWELAGAAAVVRRYRDAGVFVAVWPMLEDSEGRWASVSSIPKLVAFADALVAAIPEADEIILDVEPPHAVLDAWKRGRPALPPVRGFAMAAQALDAATRRWQRERRVTTALLPFALGRWTQRIFGTPIPMADRHSVMAYTSLFEGWSRGVLDRGRAEAVLGWCARHAVTRLGDRAALSLGAVGPGAFGDEPGYRDPGELARDVAIAAAAGITELSLFELGGVLARKPAEAWLDAFAVG
ncbi:MAG: hypothetical protein ABI867_02780 [Kofleriaceae bacterium]